MNMPEQILRNIIYQLTSNSPEAYERVKEVWNEERGIADGTMGLRELVELVVSASINPRDPNDNENGTAVVSETEPVIDNEANQ